MSKNSNSTREIMCKRHIHIFSENANISPVSSFFVVNCLVLLNLDNNVFDILQYAMIICIL